MTEYQLKYFFEACRDDADLRDRITSANTAEQVVTIAKAAGLSIDLSELLTASRGLTDKELERVAGGKHYGYTFICSFTGNKDCKVFG